MSLSGLISTLVCGAIALTLAGCGDDTGSTQLVPGQINTWMGDGTQGYDGDGKTPRATWLNQPMDLTFAPDGRAYVVDWNNHRIRRLRADGKVESLIGQDLPGDWPCQNPDDPANCQTPLSAPLAMKALGLNHPMAIEFSPGGQAYLAAWHNHKIIILDPTTGMARILAGQQVPGYAGNGGPAAAARFNFADSVVLDSRGNIFVGDERNRRIRRIAPDAAHTIIDVAGTTGAPATSDYYGDGGAALQAKFALAPYTKEDGADNPPPGGALALGPDGRLFVSDTFNHCVRCIDPGPDGVVGDGDPTQEIVWTAVGRCTSPGFSGDGGMAGEAQLNLPEDLEFGPDGLLYIADTGNHAVRRVDLKSGMIERVAGTGQRGFGGDLGPPLQAQLNSPYGLAFDAKGNLYVVDTLNNRIRVIAKP